MNEYTFFDLWRQWYPDSVPVGHLLRDQHPERWLRIYSLPGGRRYPENEADWTELLRRQTTAADNVLGSDAECLMVAAYLWTDAATLEFKQHYRLEELALIREDFPEDGSDSEEHSLDLWYAPVRWDPKAIEPALRWRAEDQGPTFLLVALSTGQVFAPYDGGVDLFVIDAGARLKLRNALRAWVSPRRDGL